MFLVGTSTAVPVLYVTAIAPCWRLTCLAGIFGSGGFRDKFELRLPFSWDFFIPMIHQFNFSIFIEFEWPLSHQTAQNSTIDSQLLLDTHVHSTKYAQHNYFYLLSQLYVLQPYSSLWWFTQSDLTSTQRTFFIALENHSQWLTIYHIYFYHLYVIHFTNGQLFEDLAKVEKTDLKLIILTCKILMKRNRRYWKHLLLHTFHMKNLLKQIEKKTNTVCSAKHRTQLFPQLAAF